MMKYSFVNWFIFCYICRHVLTAEIDNPYLKYYSTVDFNKYELNLKHGRVRRSIDSAIRISFQTDERNFDLKLWPNADTTNEIEIGGKKVTPDLIMYTGVLEDEPHDSNVLGTIIEGTFVGRIGSRKFGTYYVEPAKRYDSTAPQRRSIVYHEDDVNSHAAVISARKKRDVSVDDVGCGAANRRIRDVIAQQQKSLTQHTPKKRSSEQVTSSRQKRQTTSNPFPSNQDTCFMYLKVDPTFYTNIFNKEGNKNANTTLSYISYYLQFKMTMLNNIYSAVPSYSSNTGRTYFQYLKFKTRKIRIYSPTECAANTLSSTEQQICDSNLDEVAFLNAVAADNYTNYCLTFAFTARDFADGTIGLAYLASTDGQVGGICEKPVTVNGAMKSLNSGMVSLISYGSRVPDIVNHITFAHEVGHTLSSPHDPSQYTGAAAGNFIMYSRATSGSAVNNQRFSDNSINSISNLLGKLINSTKFCLQQFNTAICGNGIKETGEDCDPGETNTVCCQNCRRQVGCDCDPSEGLCCSSVGKYLASGTVCLATDSNSCKNNVTCSGLSADCPITDSRFFKPDNTVCNSNTQVCQNGICGGSICSLYNLQQCYLTDAGNSTDKTKLCHLACLTNNQCVDVSTLSQFNFSVYYLQPGSPCQGTQGYCDVFSRCRSYDANVTLSRLLKTLLAPTFITVQDLKEWAQTYWWAILIFCIIFAIVNILIFVCIHRHMGSDNPEKNKPLKLLETLKHPVKMFKSKKSGSRRTSVVSGRFRRDMVNPGPKEIQPNALYFNNNSLETSATNVGSLNIDLWQSNVRKSPKGVRRIVVTNDEY